MLVVSSFLIEFIDYFDRNKNFFTICYSSLLDSNDDAEEVKSPPLKKKVKLEKVSTRSRLMKICDSSDEDDVETEQPMNVDEEACVKKEKENKTPSPQKSKSNTSKNNDSVAGTKKRIKVRKMVTKTYEDLDGFISKYLISFYEKN